jgi:hypothetical protein
MNKILWLCLATLIATACKSNKETEPSSEPSQDKLIQVQPDVKKMKEAFQINAENEASTAVKQIEKRMPDFVPQSGKNNWHAVYNQSNEHLVGIFRLPSDLAWREFMATMHYADENEINKSLVWQPTEEWWVKRDVLANVKSRNLLAYKREDKTGNWYFAFNSRNYEVYFWR